MFKKTIASLVFSGFIGGIALSAEPAPRSKQQRSKKATKETVTATTPTEPLAAWSLVNGVWVHPHGYKFVRGQVVRSGIQTHKTVPKPPTQAEMNAVSKTKKKAPATPAEMAAAKAAEKERNLRPLPSRQTGTNL